MKKRSYGEQIIDALEEAVAIERGTAKPAAVRRVTLEARTALVTEAPTYSRERIAQIRQHMDVSQTVFARALNVSPDTVRAWEQGKRAPDGAAMRLLEVAEDHPGWFLERVKLTTAPNASVPSLELPRRR